MINDLACSWSSQLIKRGIINEEDREVQEYGFIALVTSVISYFSILIPALIAHCIFETIIFLLSYIVLRSFLGGWHASKPWICTLCGIMMWSAVMACYKWINISEMAQIIIFILLLIAIICIIITKALSKKRRTGSLITLACITILFILLVLVHSSYSQLLGYSLMCNILMNLLPYQHHRFYY